MELNGKQWCQQSAENLHTSTHQSAPGTGELSGGGGLQVLGQAAESTTTSITKLAPGEAVPTLAAPSAKDGSGSAGMCAMNTNDLTCRTSYVACLDPGKVSTSYVVCLDPGKVSPQVT